MGRIPMPNATQHGDAPPETVLAHGESLRALARALLGDRDLAEDAVQDTWVRYLEARPAGDEGRGDGLGGWLATVLRRLVSNRRRDAARRSERERACARRESVDEPPLREREEALRAVVEAVLALDETGRTVVMLRWFEGLPPREIAARLGVDASVVQARLARAHEKLRARLGRELGPRRSRACLACLAGLGSAPLAPWASITAIGSGGGALAMASKVLVASGAALAVVCGALWFGLTIEPKGVVADAGVETEPAGDAPAPRADAVAPATGRSEVPSTVERERERQQAEAKRPWAAPSFEYELEVTVTDEVDLPENGCTVYVAPAGHTLNEVGATDADGRLAVRWLGFEPSMELDLSIAPGDAVRRVRVDAGVRRVALRRARAPAFVSAGFELVISGDLLAGDGRLGWRISPTRSDFVHAERDADGRILFVEPALVKATPYGAALPVQPPGSKALDLHLTGLDLHNASPLVLESLGDGLVSSLRFAHPESDATAAVVTAAVRGRLVDTDGAPVAGAQVSAWRASGRSSTSTNERGEFEISGLEPGDWNVRAGGGDHGRAGALLTLGSGASFEWSPVLDRGLELRGRLLDREGAPLGGWRVEVEDDDPLEPCADSTTTGADGRFAIPNVPPRPLRLLAGHGPSGSEFAVANVVAAGERELELVVDTLAAAKSGSLQVEVVDSAGDPVELLGARAWRVDTGRALEGEVSSALSEQEPEAGTISGPPPVPSVARFLQMSPGWHRVELQLSGRAPLELAPAYVSAEETVQFGTVVAPGAARLELGGPDREIWEVAVVHRASSVELRCSVNVLASSGMGIVEGEHDVLVRTLSSAHRRHVRVAPGETVRMPR